MVGAAGDRFTGLLVAVAGFVGVFATVRTTDFSPSVQLWAVSLRDVPSLVFNFYNHTFTCSNSTHHCCVPFRCFCFICFPERMIIVLIIFAFLQIFFLGQLWLCIQKHVLGVNPQVAIEIELPAEGNTVSFPRGLSGRHARVINRGSKFRLKSNQLRRNKAASASASKLASAAAATAATIKDAKKTQ